MRSIRTKITVLTLSAVVAAVVAISFLSVLFIRQTEKRRSEQLQLLLCETGERNIDYYFNSVQKSVSNVASYISADIDGLDDARFSQHMERAKTYFSEMAAKTNGVLTYYYRVDPAVSEHVKGFWLMDLDGEGFIEHEVTDITLYDTEDTSKLVWFTVPKYEGKPIWLPPYITDNLDVRVISYNVPIYMGETFVGVVGIEIDYSTMAEQVQSIRLYNNGYAFINDEKGNLFYHPRMDVSTFTPETTPAVPEGVLSESTFLRYTFDGVDKEAAWLPLSNGMRLNVTAPVSETEGDWYFLVLNILVASLCILLVASAFILFYARRISEPLKHLIVAAEQVDNGNFDYELTYDSDDELGKLTKTFKRMSEHVKDNISDLGRQVFVDALTHVKNKGAFSASLEELQAEIDSGKLQGGFAIGMFDCDDLKAVNDNFGHERGDLYLQNASHAICSTFKSSPVYRIGGDEFAVILRNQDYASREALTKQFEAACEKTNASARRKWEEVHISMGLAEYEPYRDRAISDVVRRADKMMYANKRLRKKNEKTAKA